MHITLIDLLTSYSRSKHMGRIKAATHSASFDLSNFTFMVDPGWIATPATNPTGSLPTKISSLIIDSYSHLPNRPDMAFLQLWAAFNSAFHQVGLIKAAYATPPVDAFQDEYGITSACEVFYTRLGTLYGLGTSPAPLSFYMERILKNVPDKLCSLIATNFLKSYSIKKGGLSSRYQSRSIDALMKKFKILGSALGGSFGEAYFALTSPSENKTAGTIDLNILKANEPKAQAITRSLSDEISNLLKTGNVNVNPHNTRAVKVIVPTLALPDRIGFFVQFVLYASRNNMSHGKVSSRLNSETANKKSYDANLFMYVVCYVLLALLLENLNYGSNLVVNQSLMNMDDVLGI